MVRDVRPRPGRERQTPAQSITGKTKRDVLAKLAAAHMHAHGAELVGELEHYPDSYRICYVRGPEGIIVALAEQLS